jgi:hypothetical protein
MTDVTGEGHLMTDDERQIVESMLTALVALNRPCGPAAAQERALSTDEIEKLLADLGQWQAMHARDAQDLPYAAPDPLD